jgi:hypothetical protein
MRILYVCDKLITFILNEIIELKSKGHDLIILSYHSESIFNAITKPILIEHGLEKTYYRYSSSIFNNRKKRYVHFIKMMIYDCFVYPVRTIKIINLILKNYHDPKRGFINYFEVRDIFIINDTRCSFYIMFQGT